MPDAMDPAADPFQVAATLPELAELAAFPEQNPNPVMRVDAEGCVNYANRASRRLLDRWGVSGRGQNLPEPWSGRVAIVLQENAPRAWDAECGDRVLLLNFAPTPSCRYVNIYGSDVTELRLARDAAERRAEAQVAYNALLLANLDDAVIATDLEWRVTAWNRAAERMFGLAESETLGRRITDILSTEFVTGSAEELGYKLAEEGQWRGELLLTARDGRRVHVEATGALVRDRDGRPVGMVGVDRDITRRKEIEAQNARLVEELRANREQLAALSQRFAARREAERSHVADQLVNQAGQVLTALQLQLARLGRGDASEQMPLINATLREAIGDLHALASQLRPYTLDHSTLAGALRSRVAQFGEQHGLAVRFDSGDADTVRPKADVATSLFRSVEEGLANVAQHAGATEVRLSMDMDGDTLHVTLADDGVGFDPQKLGSAQGLGLAAIREGLKTVGGRLAIESGPGGTALRFSAPLAPAQTLSAGVMA